MQTATASAVKTVRIIPAKSEFTHQSNITQALRVAAYCRVSTDKDEQEKSYQAQKSYYTDLIMQNPEWQMAGIYADEGISGTQATKRPDFMRMIRDCKKGKIDLIITKSVQRFARNTGDSLEYSRILKTLNVGIIFETQGLDTRKMSNEFLLTIFASIAQNESENISANVKWGRQKAFKNGRVHFAYKSFLGYRKGADGKPEIIPEEAETIRRIYAEFLSGSSLRDIANGLMTDGILTAKGKERWAPEVIKSMLKNEKYVGDALLQKTYVVDCLTHKSVVNNGELPQYYVENHHPAIIERGMWNQVQEELKRRGGKRKVKEVGTITEQGKYSSKYAMTELLVCGECGKPYRRCTWSKNGKKKIVWRCINRLDYGKKYCKESPSVEESILQDTILESLTGLVRTNTAALKNLKLHIGMGLSDKDSDEDDPYTIQARIGEISAAVSKLYESQAKNKQNDYGKQFEALYKERNTLKEKLAKLKTNTDHTSAEQSRLDKIFTVTEGLKNRPLNWDEQLIRQMVECIKVTNKNQIAIRFSTGIEMEMIME
mgnify:CR=1 FL=1